MGSAFLLWDMRSSEKSESSFSSPLHSSAYAPVEDAGQVNIHCSPLMASPAKTVRVAASASSTLPSVCPGHGMTSTLLPPRSIASGMGAYSAVLGSISASLRANFIKGRHAPLPYAAATPSKSSLEGTPCEGRSLSPTYTLPKNLLPLLWSGCRCVLTVTTGREVSFATALGSDFVP